MILVVILEPFLFSLKYTWMVICILEESFLIIWNVCLTQEQKFEKGWLNDTSYDVFTWYNQLFSVWKGSLVSRWSIRSQKPKPWLPTNDEHPWKSKANSRFFVALQVYKKNESHWAHQIHWPRRRQEWRQRRQPSKGLCQSQKEVWGLKDIVFLIFHIFDNLYVELAKLWLYLETRLSLLRSYICSLISASTAWEDKFLVAA